MNRMERITHLIREREFENVIIPDFGYEFQGRWSVYPDTARLLLGICGEIKPRRILEFGSGYSTLLFDEAISRGHVEKLVSVDHLSDFKGHPKNYIKNP